MKYCLLFLCLFFFFKVDCQSDEGADLRGQLAFYADVMVNAENADHRQIAFDNFNKHFFELTKTENLYITDFSDLKWISIIEPEDKLFKLISWQVELDSGQLDFRAFLVKEDGKSFEFEKAELDRNQVAYMSLSHKEWYGCLYYNVIKSNENEYVVFGFDGSSEYQNRKIADVITLENDQIVLGKEVFEDKANKGTF